MARLRRLLLVGFTALLIVWAGGLGYLALKRSDGPTASTSDQVAQSAQNTGPFRGSKLPDGIVGRPAPDFTLSDARGRPVDTRRLAGQPYLVTFLYTNCPPKSRHPAISAFCRDPRHEASSFQPAHESGTVQALRPTERRWNRTIQAEGCSALPVLETGAF